MWPKWLTLEFWHGLWNDFVEYMDDLPIKIFKGVLEAILSVLQAITPPDFLANYKLSSIMAATNTDIGYFLNLSGISVALGLVASAVVFRVLRKLLTFGLW